MKRLTKSAFSFLIAIALVVQGSLAPSFASQAPASAAEKTAESEDAKSENKKAPEAAAPKAQPELQLNVYFLTEKGVSVAQPKRFRFQKGQNERITVEAPAIDGYAPDKKSVEIDFSAYSEAVNNIIVTYRPNLVTYTVIYKQEALDGSYFPAKTVELQGRVGELTKAPVEAFEGFTVKKAPEAQTIPVEDKSLTLEVLYSRNSYELSFQTNGATGAPARQLYYQSPIESLPVPKKTGMTFDGWFTDKQLTVPFKEGSRMPASDLKLYAKWSPADTSYNVRFMIQDANDPTRYTPAANARVAGVTGQPTQLPTGTLGTRFPDLTMEDMKNVSWFYTLDEQKTRESLKANPTIAADGSTTIDVYYNRKEITLTFVPDMNISNGRYEVVTQYPFNPDTFGWAPEITINGKTYTKPYYSIRARFGQDISALFPAPSDVKIPQDNPLLKDTEFMRFSTIYSSKGTAPGSPIYRAIPNPTMIDDIYMLCAGMNQTSSLYIGAIFNLDSFIVPGKLNLFFQKPDGTYADTPGEVRDINFAKSDASYAISFPDGFTYDTDHTVSPHPDAYGVYAYAVDWKNPEAPFCDIYLKRVKFDLTLYPDGTAKSKKDLGEIYYGYPIAGDQENPSVLPTMDDSDRPGSVPDGFVFEGWYLDPQYSVKLADGAKMPNSPFSLYGKWVPKSSVLTVTFDSSLKGDGSEAQTVQVPYGKTVERPLDPRHPGYRFIGWRVASDSRALPNLYDFNAPVVENLTLQAIWEENRVADLTVRYVKEGSGEIIKETVVKDLPVNLRYAAEAIPVDGYLPDERLKSLEVSSDPSSNVITFSYAPYTAVDYSVKCYVRDENGAETLLKEEGPFTTTRNADSKLAPSIDGYAPVGRIRQTMLFVQSPEKNVFEFFYRDAAKGSYTVEYYYGDGKGSYEQDESKTAVYSVSGGASVSVNPPKAEGHYFLNVKKSVLSGEVVGTENTVLKVYYDLELKDGSYTVKYYYGDGNGSFKLDAKKTEYHVAPVGTTVTANPAEKEGDYVLVRDKSVLTGTVTWDTNPVLKVYYEQVKKPAPAPAPKPVKPAKPSSGSKPKTSPKTGDPILLTTAAPLAAAALLELALLKRRKRNEKQ